MALDLSKLNEIDFNNLGSMPVPIRAGIIGVLCLVLVALGYVLDIQGMRSDLASAQQQEISLKKDFEEKQNKAANLEGYKQQMKDMEDAFGTMLRQLPSKNEVADLLVDVTQTGLANGLTIETVKPGAEKPLDFYAEMPISLEVSGSYHDFGGFVSGVAALPRIVTLHDISITPQSGKGGRLLMKAAAKTYRYLDPQEIAAERAKAAAAAKGKGKKGK
jgi:type IV pilus assembly protein PilO